MPEDIIVVKKRFIQVREALNLSQKELANAIGKDKSAISKIESEKELKRLPSLSIMLAMEELFNVNRNYIETGTGEIFKSLNTPQNELKSTNRKIQANAKYVGDFHESEYEDGSKFRRIGPETFAMRVELVTEKAKAGWLRGFADGEYIEELPMVEIPVDFIAKGMYLAFEVDGDSMDDRTIDCIPNNTIIVGRDLPQHQWSPRLYSHEYPNWIFVHKRDGILVKQIADQDLEAGWIIHHSLNPNKELYPDEKIYVKDLIKIYNVVKRILP